MPGFDRKEFAAAPPLLSRPKPAPLRDRRVYVLAALLALGVFALIATIVASDYAETKRRAESSLANLANALEKDIARNIELWDLSIRETQAALALPGLAEADAAVRQSALFGPIDAAEYIAAVLVLDARGNVVADSASALPRVANLSDRPFFEFLRDHPAAGLYIGGPFQSRFTADRVIVFARRITRPDGSFGGVVAGSVLLDYFQHLFSELELGQDGAVALLRTDGTLLARYPADPPETGRVLAGTEPFERMLREQIGVSEAVSTIDHVARIYAFRRVGSLPLLLTVSNGRAAVFASWQRKAALVLTSVVVLLTLAGTLLVLLRRELRRRAVAERQALDSALVARRSERTLALSLAQLDTVFQNSADAHFAASRRADGRFAYDLLNRRAEELTGTRAEALIGRTPDECLIADAAAAELSNWERCLQSGNSIVYEQTLLKPNGRIFWETHLVPVHDTAGAIYRLIGTARDVTDRKRSEATLLDLNSKLERRAAAATAAQDDALQRASSAERLQVLGQLASGIAHDVNNVLQSVAGGAAMLERRADEPQAARRAARLIADAAARGASITHRLLKFSRENVGATERVPITPILADLVEILRHTLRGDGPIEFRVRCDDDTLTVLVDPNQLQTVLLNLATNARDAMPDGGLLTLGADTSDRPPPDLAPGHYVRLWVEDNGSGMDPDILGRVTEPFFTTKPVGEGTGLGLSMADAFARESGGRLQIDSTVGRGTLVALWLRR